MQVTGRPQARGEGTGATWPGPDSPAQWTPLKGPGAEWAVGLGLGPMGVCLGQEALASCPVTRLFEFGKFCVEMLSLLHINSLIS